VTRAVLVLALLGACECGRGAEEPAAVSEPEAAEPVHVGHLHPGDEIPEPPEGADLERFGCEQGRVEDCLAVAERTPEDRRQAMAMACQRGGRLCAQAGDPELLEDGCRGGSVAACRAWAEHAEDPTAARRIGCAAGWLEVCEERVAACDGTLADCARRARVAFAAGELEEAERLARVGCDGERTATCVVWAEVYGQREPDAARIALRRACWAEDAAACDALLGRDDLSPNERRTAEALARGLAF